MNVSHVEYLWLDGAKPTQQLRSKSRVLAYNSQMQLSDLPEWSFDGSSTGQAEGNDSDCLLNPVSLITDPIRGKGNYLVLCEVLNADGSIHASNQRAKLRHAMEVCGYEKEPYIGFEQEYTFFKDSRPLGWPVDGYPAPQGPFYCAVGSKNVFGREIVEEHTKVCVEAGLCLYGINAEVMPGQWEFQIGYRNIEGEKADPLTMSDHMWFARYLLHRVAEEHAVEVSFSNKPIEGDWNGAGMHTNFSTNQTRSKTEGKKAIDKAIENLEFKHKEHIEVYGAGLAQRLTGNHETCSINEFKSGVSHRGASIRIPVSTASNGYGYLEDRRPGANSDPYLVSLMLVNTICSE